MAKIDLDKYYTPVELSKYCIDKTYEIIEKDNISEVIEPSAGDGSFSLQIPNCISYDIEPEHDSIIKQDFLNLDLDYKKGRLIIGNPPFGKFNTLSIKFFKKSITLADYISFILPISQLNNNNYFYEFDLVHSEDLNKDIYSNTKVHCCLNVFKRPLKRFNKRPKYKLEDLSLRGVSRGRFRNDKVPDIYDFSICSFGSVGKICTKENEYCQQIYFTINNPLLKDRITDVIRSADWRARYKIKDPASLQQWQIITYLKEQIPEIK